MLLMVVRLRSASIHLLKLSVCEYINSSMHPRIDTCTLVGTWSCRSLKVLELRFSSSCSKSASYKSLKLTVAESVYMFTAPIESLKTHFLLRY